MVKLLVMLSLLYMGCDPMNTEFEDIEDANSYQASSITAVQAKDTLKVMDWNVKFGGGRIDFFFDCYGNRSLMTEKEVTANLDILVAKINAENPDILTTQEIDIDSKRGAYVDQVQYILDHTNLNYASYASQWKADYVPSDGIGRVNSGNAIFSKYKIENAQRIALPLIEEQDAITEYFYLRRAILDVDVIVGTKKVKVLDTHTSAFAHDGTKGKQMEIFTNRLLDYKKQNETIIAAGDLNTIPPVSTKWQNFPDSKCTDEEYQADDYSGEEHILDSLYAHFSPAIELDSIVAHESKYFSHTTDKNGFWNRKLDYIFTNKGKIVEGSGMVHQLDFISAGVTMMQASDHACVTAKVVIK